MKIGNWLVGAAILADAIVGPVCAAPLIRADQQEEAVAFQLNPARTGSINFAAGFATPLTKLWSFDTGGPVSYALIAGGYVYVVSSGNDVFALNAFTGKRNWEHLLGGSSNLGAYDNGVLFYDNENGQLTALSAPSGKQLWGAQVPADYSPSAPIAFNGQVFVSPGALSAVDEAKGTVQWTEEIEGTDGSPAYGDGGLYTGGPSQYFKYGLDGKLIWHNAGCCSGGGGISPVYFGQRVYLTDWAEGNFVLKSRTGAVAGSFPGYTTPAFFVGSSGRSFELAVQYGEVDCLSVRTGNVVWKYVNENLSSYPIVVNGQPVIGTNSGDVYVLSSRRGKPIWSANVGDGISSIAAGDGVLAVSAGNKITVFAPQ